MTAARAVAAMLGLAMIALPAFWLPSVQQVITVAGLLLVGASVAGPLARHAATGATAATAAVAQCALGRPGAPVTAAEGLLMLGYLLMLDAPAAAPRLVLGRWLRLQAPWASWGAGAVAVTAAALALHAPPVLGFTVAGVAAAVAATVLAVPREPALPAEPAEPAGRSTEPTRAQ